MTDQPLCPHPHCARPIHDTAYVCRRCADQLARDLWAVARTAGDAQDTIARLVRQGGGSTGEERLPYDPTAAAVLDEAVNTLTTWARHIHEQAGRALPVVRLASARYCLHISCANLRRTLSTDLVGPVCPPARPAQHPLEVLARWLAGELQWLRYRPEADEAFDELADATRRLIRLVDRPPDRWYAGPCDTDSCDEHLHPVAGAKTISCPGCEAQYDPDERKAWLLEQIDDQEAPAATAAMALTALGCRVSADQVRQWAHRNQLLPRAGTRLYRIGDVRALVVEAAHRDLDRRIKQARREAEAAKKAAAEQEEMMVA